MNTIIKTIITIAVILLILNLLSIRDTKTTQAMQAYEDCIQDQYDMTVYQVINLTGEQPVCE